MLYRSIVAFRMTEDQLRQVQLLARLEGMSVSEVIRAALRDRTEQVVSRSKEEEPGTGR
jgi:hypothetical protein